MIEQPMLLTQSLLKNASLHFGYVRLYPPGVSLLLWAERERDAVLLDQGSPTMRKQWSLQRVSGRPV